MVQVASTLITSDSGAAFHSETTDAPSRLVFMITILELTACSTLFYKLLPPECFAKYAWRNSSNNLLDPLPAAEHVSVCDFATLVLNPRSMFHVPWGKLDPSPYKKVYVTSRTLGVKESKRDDDDDDDGDERKPLVQARVDKGDSDASSDVECSRGPTRESYEVYREGRLREPERRADLKLSINELGNECGT